MVKKNEVADSALYHVYCVQTKIPFLLQIEIFPYSVFYMFFEQYLNIWKTALVNLAIAIG